MNETKLNRGLKRYLVVLALAFGVPFFGFTQEDEDFFKSLLDTIVEVQNPSYKPVIALGSGYINFYGDIRNPVSSPLFGNFAAKVNLSYHIDAKQFFRGNFFAIMGSVAAHDQKISFAMQHNPLLPIDDFGNPIYINSAFKTDLFQLGLSVEYNFGHIFGASKRFKPVLGVGLSTILFSPKGNVTNRKSDDYYYFWSDGTIRNFAEYGPNAYRARIVRFDDSYETDLSGKDFFNQGSIPQQTFSALLDFGLDFYLSDRVNLRVGSAFNYTFTDRIDNYDKKTATSLGYPVKNEMNDLFAFTYFTMNFDLFSDPKSILVERVFAMWGEDYDYQIFFADSDGDGVFDRFDDCLDTPTGVEVDSIGCPMDSDLDGVFDYMDKENSTPEGATVDESGVQVSADVLAAMYSKKNEAVLRKEIKLIPLTHVWSRNLSFTPGKLPDRFKNIDTDSDGYISFHELIRAINDYFDGTNNLTLQDLYDMNEFFFTQ